MKKKFNRKREKDKDIQEALITLLVEEFTPLQIYQFAQTKQKKSSQSVFASSSKQMHKSDYLLLITKDNSCYEKSLQNFVDRHVPAKNIIVLLHTQEMILMSNNPSKGFFTKIIMEGHLHHTSSDLVCYTQLSMPNQKKQLGRAIVHWRTRIQMADGFITAAEQAVESGHEQVSLFLLNQTVEQCCKGLIYVFMGYQPLQCNIENLLRLSACFSKLPLQHFTGSPGNEMLLTVLTKCVEMIGNPSDFSLGNQSIYRFLELVESFIVLTKQMCEMNFKEKQQELGDALNNYKPII